MTNFDPPQAINMPSKFTSAEAKFFKQMFKKNAPYIQPINNNSATPSTKKMVFDFQTTSFIDQGGLAGLCQIIKLAKESKVELSFSHFSPEIKIILSLIGLEKVFPITE